MKHTKDLDYIANQLDSRFQGPFGFRFGWDGLLGLIPGLGNLVTSSFSFYIILRSAIMGVPPVILVRMGFNVLIDNVVDKIPVLGFLFDFVWKANEKNVALLKRALLNPAKVKKSSGFWIFFILFLILITFLAAVAAGFYLLWLSIEILHHYWTSTSWS